MQSKFTRCTICNHPEREALELALAMTQKRVAGGVVQVAVRFGVSKSAAHRHLSEHMSQDHVARLRMGVPAAIDANIMEIIQRQGEGAILVLRDLKARFLQRADILEKLKDYDGSRKELAEAAKVSRDLVLYAGLIPGRKTVTNNTLVIADGAEVFDIVTRALAEATTVQEARSLVASAYKTLAATPNRPALEHLAA